MCRSRLSPAADPPAQPASGRSPQATPDGSFNECHNREPPHRHGITASRRRRQLTQIPQQEKHSAAQGTVPEARASSICGCCAHNEREEQRDNGRCVISQADSPFQWSYRRSRVVVTMWSSVGALCRRFGCQSPRFRILEDIRPTSTTRGKAHRVGQMRPLRQSFRRIHSFEVPRQHKDRTYGKSCWRDRRR